MSEVYYVLPAPGCFPGVSAVMADMAALGGKVIYADEYRQIKREDLAIFGAYHTNYALPIRRLECKKFVLWTSPLLQTELSPDEMSLFQHILKLRDANIIDHIWFGDLGMSKAFKNKGFYAPYPMHVDKVTKHRMERQSRNGLSLFCPWTPRKNILTQLAAVKLAQEDDPSLVLYGNEMHGYADFANKMGVSYVDCGWMPTEAYYDKIQEVKAGLQVFLSESFCYTAFEHLILGTPIIASSAIDWAPDRFKVKNLDDPVEMADKILEVSRMEVGVSTQEMSDLREFANMRNKRILADIEAAKGL